MIDEINLGTINGKPITKELLESLSSRCEQGWADDEVTVVPTNHSKAFAALSALDVPVEEMDLDFNHT